MSLHIEKSVDGDAELFKKILLQPGMLDYFPMVDLREVEDSVQVWEFVCKKGASLTSFYDGVACGLAYLNIQVYKKFAHQCLITIVVDEGYRNKGIGTALLKELSRLAKESFHLEILHLEVYENNPAISLYKRMGFVTFGTHAKFIKEKGRYIAKIFMQRPI